MLTSLAYSPALRGGFILDDNILLTENPLIKASDGIYRFWLTTQPIDYWPVYNTVLWFEWRLWGMNQTGYHVVNLILHIASAWLIWAIFRRLSIPGAFVAALLFAVHPVNVESVAWITQLKSVLALFFALLSILSYLQAECPPAPRVASRLTASRWYGLSVVGFVLAMLSKGSAAVVPALLLGILACLRRLTPRDLLKLSPFFAVAGVLTIVNAWFQTHGAEAHVVRTATAVERVLAAAGAVWFYLSKALFPLHLSLVYPQWEVHTNQWQWWMPVLALLALSLLLWRYRHRWSRPLLWAWAYFCVALVPVLGFTNIAFMEHSLVADRYLYIPIIGVMGLVGAGWSAWERRARGAARWAAHAAIVMIVTALILRTRQQSSLYVNGLTLYEATVETNPKSSLARNNLGGALYESGQRAEAIAQWEEALRLKPNDPAVHSNLATAFRQSGRLAEAIQHAETALGLKPDYPEAHYNLGAALGEHGRPQEAIAHFDQALRLKQDYAEAHNDAGVILARDGRLGEAIERFQDALLLKPDYADARDNLRLAVSMQQKAERAGTLEDR